MRHQPLPPHRSKELVNCDKTLAATGKGDFLATLHYLLAWHSGNLARPRVPLLSLTYFFIMNAPCQHFAALDLHHLKHDAQHICPECVALGDTWVHLRICQQCGHVGCCDDSKNKHATKHFRATQHPVITSAQPGERWAWCYPDEAFLEY
jgi:hypothetical protein